MKVGISGGSGLIGRALSEYLDGQGCQVTVLGRTPVPGSGFVHWDAAAAPPPVDALTGLDAFVHLAGEPIAGGRWTEDRKRAIRDSRVLGTRHLVEACMASPEPPRVLVSSSAVGYYGDRGEEELTEDSTSGTGFLSEICRQWEAEAVRVSDSGVRVVLLRTGVVLSLKGGAFAQMLPPFRLGLGGKLGSGKQYLSWIHLADQVRMIEAIISDHRFEGPVNATAPAPVTNREFTKVLSKVLGRPAWFAVPGAALRLAMGEMAEALLLEGQRVLPAKAQELGFSFRFTELQPALRELLMG